MEFEELYGQHFSAVYRFLLSLCRNEHLAEEITQEAFFRAMQKWSDYRGRCSPETWLCSIAKHCFFDHMRRQKRIVPEMETDALPGVPVESMLSERETLRQLHRALHQLEEPYKEVFTLRVFGELEYRQIGELFGKTENWCRVTYYRAKLKLQETMRKEYPNE